MLQDKIIQTNPILEAFGNAMTAGVLSIVSERIWVPQCLDPWTGAVGAVAKVRNNNSSRFGKWTLVSGAGSCGAGSSDWHVV